MDGAPQLGYAARRAHPPDPRRRRPPGRRPSGPATHLARPADRRHRVPRVAWATGRRRRPRRAVCRAHPGVPPHVPRLPDHRWLRGPRLPRGEAQAPRPGREPARRREADRGVEGALPEDRRARRRARGRLRSSPVRTATACIAATSARHMAGPRPRRRRSCARSSTSTRPGSTRPRSGSSSSASPDVGAPRPTGSPATLHADEVAAPRSLDGPCKPCSTWSCTCPRSRPPRRKRRTAPPSS